MVKNAAPERIVLAIDPGVHRCAGSLFLDTTLVAATEDVTEWSLPRVGRVVVERPQYQGERSDKARTHLMALSWAGAMVAYSIAVQCEAEVREVPPSEWKRSLPKPLVHVNMWECLSDPEREVLGGEETYTTILDACERGAKKRWPANWTPYRGSFTMHNVLDSAGIGLFDSGRFEL